MSSAKLRTKVNLTCRTVFGLHKISKKDALTIFDGISGWFSSFNVALAFPLIPKIALKLPDWLTARIVPGYLCILQVRYYREHISLDCINSIRMFDSA